MATTKTPKTPKTAKGTKKRKADPANATEIEKNLTTRYPHIVPGTLKEVGAIPSYGAKRTIEIACQNKGWPIKRRVATSDLHQTKYCEDCIRTIRLERRQTAKTSKPTKAKRITKKRTKKTTEPEPITT